MKYLSGLLTASVVLCAASCTTAPVLPRDNWADSVYSSLSATIREASRQEGSYAVFDCDNTTIINDVSVSLLHYQLNNLLFRIKPGDFFRTLSEEVSDLDMPVMGDLTVRMFLEDMTSDYAFLYENYIGERKMTLEQISRTEEFLDFRVKYSTLEVAVSQACDYGSYCLWILKSYFGFTYPELEEMVKASCRYWMASGDVVEVTWTSPDRGVCGSVTSSHLEGIKVTDEMKHLYQTLAKAGIDVYICSASLEFVVEALACNPEFGIGIDRDHVFALRFADNGKDTINVHYSTDYVQPYKEGKTAVIRKYIAPSHLDRGPVLVAGDSNGDYSMLTSFPDLGLGLIINCGNTGPIGELAGSGREGYVVQPRSIGPAGFVRN